MNDLIKLKNQAQARMHIQLADDMAVHFTYLSTVRVTQNTGEDELMFAPLPDSAFISKVDSGPFDFRLYHGRDDADQQMEDMGYPGPAFRVTAVHVTAQNVRLHTERGVIDLPTQGDLVKYTYGLGKTEFFGDFMASTP